MVKMNNMRSVLLLATPPIRVFVFLRESLFYTPFDFDIEYEYEQTLHEFIIRGNHSWEYSTHWNWVWFELVTPVIVSIVVIHSKTMQSVKPLSLERSTVIICSDVARSIAGGVCCGRGVAGGGSAGWGRGGSRGGGWAAGPSLSKTPSVSGKETSPLVGQR